VHLRASVPSAEVFGHHRVSPSLGDLRGQREALRFVIEFDGSPARRSGSIFPRTKTILNQVRLQMWCFSMPERRKVRLLKLLRSTAKQLYRRIGIERDVLDGLAFSSRSLEDAMLQV
jgi:hypothetical protein